ncbi:MAG: DUF1028 domain-containing protein [Ktedonobacterales bacterium]
MSSQMSRPIHTYSIVARDPATGALGVAVQSHAFSVGSIVPWVEAGVGAVATQSLTRVDYGPEGLALMRRGQSAREALDALVQADEGREVRQVAMVDAHGNVAVHTGSRCIPAAGHRTGDQFSVQANLMVDDTVWPAMYDAYAAAPGDLAERMLAALTAAQHSGGDIRGQQSAALIVVSGTRSEDKSWEGRLFDLRVDDHPRPIEELRRLVHLRRAYRSQDESDELLAQGRHEEAVAAIRQALALAPDVQETRFWSAVTLFRMEREKEALDLFAEVFAKEPIWLEVVPRLVSAGLAPDDPAAIKRITDVLTR